MYQSNGRIRLRGVRLRGVNLSGLHLSKLDLADADFSYVDTEGEGAVFEDAFCLEGCEFGGANLRDALFVDLPTFTNHI
ncbi:hypothetical protein TB2_028627 [Malus domestica]